jgi:TPR repeat protein
MDPFKVLPVSLAVRVLLLMGIDPSRRPENLRGALLVSRLWNATAMQQELWIDLDLSRRPLENSERLLARAHGCLRTLTWRCPTSKVFTSPLWDGAIKRSCASRGGPVVVCLDCDGGLDRDLPGEAVERIAASVGSPALQSLALTGTHDPAIRVIVREILQRSPNLHHLSFHYDSFITSDDNDAWLPIPSPRDKMNDIPLGKLQTLSIYHECPKLWEHLSSSGVQLSGVVISDAYGCYSQSENPNLTHLLEVIGGPQLLDFCQVGQEWDRFIPHQLLEAVARHPRRSIAVNLVDDNVDVSILKHSVAHLEELGICFGNVPEYVERVLEQPMARLRSLTLHNTRISDAALSRAIRAVNGTLESLSLDIEAIDYWDSIYPDPNARPFDQTTSAIGTVKSLRSLIAWGQFSYTELEPILIGIPPDEPPLCPRVRYASIQCMFEGSMGGVPNRLSQDGDVRRGVIKFARRFRMSMLDRSIFEGSVEIFVNEEDDQALEEAMKWYRMAIDGGDVEAQLKFGVYCDDTGDPAEATNWYRKAADQGNVDAQVKLGLCYKTGRGVEKDPKMAVYWYRRSAEQENAAAQFELGYCYWSGNGVPKDLEKAIHWYRRSANQNHAPAQFRLGYCYEKGRGVEIDLEKAVRWYRKSAKQNHAPAQFRLGYCYEKGRGVEIDMEKAFSWYRKSAKQNHARAQVHLGAYYEIGRGVTKNVEKAVYWFRKSADQNHAPAQHILGSCYEEGRGVEIDLEKAVHWYRKSADQGDEFAIKKLLEIQVIEA